MVERSQQLQQDGPDYDGPYPVFMETSLGDKLTLNIDKIRKALKAYYAGAMDLDVAVSIIKEELFLMSKDDVLDVAKFLTKM